MKKKKSYIQKVDTNYQMLLQLVWDQHNTLLVRQPPALRARQPLQVGAEERVLTPLLLNPVASLRKLQQVNNAAARDGLAERSSNFNKRSQEVRIGGHRSAVGLNQIQLQLIELCWLSRLKLKGRLFDAISNSYGNGFQGHRRKLDHAWQFELTDDRSGRRLGSSLLEQLSSGCSSLIVRKWERK